MIHVNNQGPQGAASTSSPSYPKNPNRKNIPMEKDKKSCLIFERRCSARGGQGGIARGGLYVFGMAFSGIDFGLRLDISCLCLCLNLIQPSLRKG